MKKMVICWIFLISVLFVTILYFGYSFIDSISGYQTLENDMVEASDFYLDINKIDLAVGEGIRLEGKQLIDAKLLSSMAVEEDECEGYVEIKRNITNYDYKAYIKCDSYETEGYEE